MGVLAEAMPVNSGARVAPGRRPGQNLAEFMQRRGRRIAETPGCLWHSVENRFFMSVPYNLPVDPDPDAVHRLLESERAVGVRFPSMHRAGLPGGFYACSRKPYELGTIHQKMRSLVRRGIETFAVRPIEEAELLRQGMQLNRDTLARQGRYDPEFGEQAHWEKLVRAVYTSVGVVAHGAFSGCRLAAYMITCRDDGWLHILHQMSRSETLQQNPNHALTFTVTSVAAADPTLQGTSYGLVSLLHTDGLHLYKTRLGYEVVERTSCFEFHPLLASVLGSQAACVVARFLQRVRPQDQRIEKIEAVLRGARTPGLLAVSNDSGLRETLGPAARRTVSSAVERAR